MSTRVTKQIAHELIQYVKRIDIKANFWDPTSKSAIEFSRQMSSPKLKKINPSLECELSLHTLKDPPAMSVEFLNGTVWKTDTVNFQASDLRFELFSKAEEVEESYEKAGGKPVTAAPADAAKKPGKGKK